MFLEWVKGVLFRPGDTFAWAQQNLRFGYWWILLSVLTLEIISTIYSPALDPEMREHLGVLILWVGTILILIFDLQALLLLGAGRLFRWQLSWQEALKYTGLAWSVILVEATVGFIPALRGWHQLILWLGIPFGIWYVAALTAGVRRVTGFATIKALGLTLLASVPWQAGLFWLNWRSLR